MSWAFDNLPVVGFDDYHAPLPKSLVADAVKELEPEGEI